MNYSYVEDYIISQIDLRKGYQRIKFNKWNKEKGISDDRKWYICKGGGASHVPAKCYAVGLNGTSFHFLVKEGREPAETKERIAKVMMNPYIKYDFVL